MGSTVLIITNDHDSHASAVIRELNERGVVVFRFHPPEFPDAYSVSIEIGDDGRIEGEIKNAHRRVEFSDICAAWYRRSRNVYDTPVNLSSATLDNYIAAQTSATLAALSEGLDTLWVGHPPKLRRAEVKALQLALASKAGLKTPHTLISNDPARAEAFIDMLGGAECAIKPLFAAGASNEEGYRVPLTTTLPPDYPLESVSLAPNIFQPYIEKAFELRCVVIGDRIFCARINSHESDITRKDHWRAGDREYDVYTLPEDVQAAIRRLIASFEINFATIDLIVTPEGEIVFLELNPNGQWLWLELKLGLPLVASMADLLTTHRSEKRELDSAALTRR